MDTSENITNAWWSTCSRQSLASVFHHLPLALLFKEKNCMDNKSLILKMEVLCIEFWTLVFFDFYSSMPSSVAVARPYPRGGLLTSPFFDLIELCVYSLLHQLTLIQPLLTKKLTILFRCPLSRLLGYLVFV